MWHLFDAVGAAPLITVEQYCCWRPGRPLADTSCRDTEIVGIKVPFGGGHGLLTDFVYFFFCFSLRVVLVLRAIARHLMDVFQNILIRL